MPRRTEVRCTECGRIVFSGKSKSLGLCMDCHQDLKQLARVERREAPARARLLEHLEEWRRDS